MISVCKFCPMFRINMYRLGPLLLNINMNRSGPLLLNLI